MLIWLYCLCRRTFQMEVEVAALTDSICLIWKCLTKERLRLNGFDVMNHSDVVPKDSNKALNKIKTGFPKAKLVFSSLSFSKFIWDEASYFYIMLIWLYCFCRRMLLLKVQVASVLFEVVLIPRLIVYVLNQMLLPRRTTKQLARSRK